MIATIVRPSGKEQRFVQTGVSWEDFKSIQQGFQHSPGVRLFYYLGELEILSISPEHEIVKGNIGYLLEDFMLSQEIDFIGTGSFSQERNNEASVQADESYCFGTRNTIPDLAIEVVITSGGPDKLKRYRTLGVQEVWFWQDGNLTIHQLTATGYQDSSSSQFVKGIDVEMLAKCAAIESRAQAVRAFRKG